MVYPATPPEKPLAPRWVGEFKSYENWCNKASSWIDKHAVCVDALGRRCLMGADFMRARDEGAFPVRFFWELIPMTDGVFVDSHADADGGCSSRYYDDDLISHGPTPAVADENNASESK